MQVSNPSPYTEWREALGLTFVADTDDANGTARAEDNLAAFTSNFAAYCIEKLGLECSADLAQICTDPDDQRRFSSQAKCFCLDRKFFLTADGHFGLGPPCMQTQDTIAVLFGGDVPFILRPTDSGTSYKLIGECYLHGFMRGEAIIMQRCLDLKTQDIILI